MRPISLDGPSGGAVPSLSPLHAPAVGRGTARAEDAQGTPTASPRRRSVSRGGGGHATGRQKGQIKSGAAGPLPGLFSPLYPPGAAPAGTHTLPHTPTHTHARTHTHTHSAPFTRISGLGVGGLGCRGLYILARWLGSRPSTSRLSVFADTPPPLSCLKSTYPHFTQAKCQDVFADGIFRETGFPKYPTDENR